MNERVNVMTAEQYFNKYGNEGIGKGADRWMIKRQLLDAIRKEAFGLVAERMKKRFDSDPPEGDPEARRILKSVVHDTVMKWKKIVGMFEKYKETAGLLKVSDLNLFDDGKEELNGTDQGNGTGMGDQAETGANSGSSGEANESSGEHRSADEESGEDPGEEKVIETDGYSAVMEEDA